MTSPPANAPSPDAPRPIRRGAIALGWGLVCAAVAGGIHLGVFLLLGQRIDLPNAELKDRLTWGAVIIVVTGIIGAALGAAFVGLLYPVLHSTPRMLARGGALTATVGGGLTIPTVILCRAWLSPLASSTALWCIVGFLAGVGAYRFSFVGACTAPSEDNTERGGQHRWIFLRALMLLAATVCIFLMFLTILTTRY